MDVFSAGKVIFILSYGMARALAQPPSIEDLFGGAEEEIGSEPPEDLPPAPDEQKEDALTKARRDLRRVFAKGVSEAMGQIPHTGLRRTWVNSVEDWANRQLHGVSEISTKSATRNFIACCICLIPIRRRACAMRFR